MTDLQDAILDALVGKTIGVNWPTGPLTIAAEVIGGEKPIKFGQSDNDRGAKSEIAQRLGYPVLLCEAIQGANRGLEVEDERRTLAMTLFRTIPIGGKVPKLSAKDQNRIALQMALRAHPYVCKEKECAVPGMITSLLDAPDITVVMVQNALDVRCKTAKGRLADLEYLWLTARSNEVDRLVQTVVMALRGLGGGKSIHGWCSLRESARLAASQRGMAEALDCCIDIARQCGLAV